MITGGEERRETGIQLKENVGKYKVLEVIRESNKYSWWMQTVNKNSSNNNTAIKFICD